MRVYTSGDLAFALQHDILIPNSYRVTHSKDIVVNLPPLFFLYFFHHRQEVFYQNEDMKPGAKYKLCKDDEDFSCANGEFGISIEDHTHYFGVSVSGYGTSDACKQRLI
jgi:hypothetical protein